MDADDFKYLDRTLDNELSRLSFELSKLQCKHIV